MKGVTFAKKFSSDPPPLPMQSIKIPSYPGEIISLDTFDSNYGGKKNQYLVIVDHYSDFFEVKYLRDMTSRTTIKLLKDYFCKFGVSSMMIADNARQFISKEMREFSQEWGFEIVVSDPHHPQGNGKAEATVKVAKQILKKSDEAGEDFYLMLLHHRNTPNSSGLSPNDRMFGRQSKIPNIPQIKHSLFSKDYQNVHNILENKKRMSKRWYDKRSRTLPDLNVGQPVFVRLEKEKPRVKGTIIDQVKDRSYLVQTDSGVFRRNRIAIVSAQPSEPVIVSPTTSNNFSNVATPQTRQSPTPSMNSSSSSNFDGWETPQEQQNRSHYEDMLNHNNNNVSLTVPNNQAETPKTSRFGRTLKPSIRLQDFVQCINSTKFCQSRGDVVVCS